MIQGPADPERDGVADYVRHLTAALHAAGDEVVPVPVDGVRKTANRVRAWRPDVVHVQFAPSAFGFSALPGLLPDLVRDRPWVTTLHEYGWWSVAAPACRRCCGDRSSVAGCGTARRGGSSRAAAAILTTNPGHAHVVRQRFGRTAIHVPARAERPGPVLSSGPADRAATRRRLGVPEDAQVVAFFGFVHPVKGLRYLIEALARLRATGRRPAAPARPRRFHLARPARGRSAGVPRRADRLDRRPAGQPRT